jgi:hypothetical protein
MTSFKQYRAVEQTAIEQENNTGTKKSVMYVSKRHLGFPQFNSCPLRLLWPCLAGFLTGGIVECDKKLCSLYCVPNKKILPEDIEILYSHCKMHTNRVKTAGRQVNIVRVQLLVNHRHLGWRIIKKIVTCVASKFFHLRTMKF